MRKQIVLRQQYQELILSDSGTTWYDTLLANFLHPVFYGYDVTSNPISYVAYNKNNWRWMRLR